jgi:hypothetical protein
MGYTTIFKGVLKFTNEITNKQLQKLQLILGGDCRQHPEWHTNNLSYIDLRLTDDFEGVEWDGSEKTYDLPEKVNLVVELMRKDYPDFGLTGSLVAQGEDIEDRWILTFDNGEAVKRDTVIDGDVIECPDCGHRFILEKKAGN